MKALFWYCSEAVRDSLCLKQFEIYFKIYEEDLSLKTFYKQEVFLQILVMYS